MKTLLIAIACLIASKGFSQTSELKVEEKSSDWITITAPATVAKSKAATRKRKTHSNKPQPQKKEEQEFEKTNNQVNRFKKKQG